MHQNNSRPRFVGALVGLEELLESPLLLQEVRKDLQEIREILNGELHGLQRIDQRVIEHSDKLEETTNSLREVKGCLQALYQKQEQFEESSKRETMLTEAFFESRIVEPMVKLVFPAVDMAGDCIALFTKQNAEKFFRGLRDTLIEFLARYDIEVIEHKHGDFFDRNVMQPVKFTATCEAVMADRVARSVRAGFRRGERTLRSEQVELFKWRVKEDTSDYTQRDRHYAGRN